MLTLKKIAITGPLSSGKSTVLDLFREMGAYVLDADKVVHNLFNHRSDIKEKVIRLLGKEVIGKDGIDRKKVAKLVFEDPLLLSQLETILHPQVRKEVQEKYLEAIKEKKWSTFVVEIPLLFETEFPKIFDHTVLIYADEAICFKRFEAKTKHSKNEYDKRMRRQICPKQKIKRVDFVLYNDGSLENLKSAAQKVYTQITG